MENLHEMGREPVSNVAEQLEAMARMQAYSEEERCVFRTAALLIRSHAGAIEKAVREEREACAAIAMRVHDEAANALQLERDEGGLADTRTQALCSTMVAGDMICRRIRARSDGGTKGKGESSRKGCDK